MASHIVSLRLNDDELELVDARAKAMGASRSQYIRFLIDSDFFAYIFDAEDLQSAELKPADCVPYIDGATIKRATHELVKQGVNVNQGAKALNQLAHLARENKALRIDWQSYCGVAERALYKAAEELARIADDLDALVEHAGYNRNRGCGKGGGRDANA